MSFLQCDDGGSDHGRDANDGGSDHGRARGVASGASGGIEVGPSALGAAEARPSAPDAAEARPSAPDAAEARPSAPDAAGAGISAAAPNLGADMAAGDIPGGDIPGGGMAGGGMAGGGMAGGGMAGSLVPTVVRSRLGHVLVAAVLALAADVISKVLIVANIGPDHRPVRILGGAISLIQARNSGAAFSVGTGATVVLTVVSVVVIGVIVRTARQLTSSWWAVSLGLILGGALGNLTDRLLRAPAPGRGHVVDWIALHPIRGCQYPIFNLADSCIVVGAGMALVLSVLGVELRSRAGRVLSVPADSSGLDG